MWIIVSALKDGVIPKQMFKNISFADLYLPNLQTSELTMLNLHYFVNFFDLCVKWLDFPPPPHVFSVSIVSGF